MKDNDIICISETFHTDSSKLPIPSKLSVVDSLATKKAARGRASGGLAIIYNSAVYKSVDTLFINEHYIFVKLIIQKSILIIGNTYINRETNIEKVLTEIEEILNIINEEYSEAQIIIGGDFNARIAEEGKVNAEQLCTTSNISMNRNSCDKVIDKRGQMLLDFCNKNEMYVANGRVKGDLKGNFTYVGSQGCSVIDIVLCNYVALCNAIDFEILDEIVNSGHKIVSFKCELYVKANFNGMNGTDKNESLNLRVKWKENLIDRYLEGMKWSPNVGFVELDINGLASNFTNTIIEVAEKIDMVPKKKFKFIETKKPWYDDECYQFKKVVKRCARAAKKNNFTDNERIKLIKIKYEYFQFLRNKREIFNIIVVNIICQSKDSEEFWRNLNLFRFNRKSDSNEIDLSTWYDYLAQISPPKIRDAFLPINASDCVKELDGEIILSEITWAIKKCKKRKAPGLDGITNEFIKNLPDNWLMYLYILFNKILAEGKIPDSWTDIVAKMLHKKGDKSDPENYRQISLVNSIVKIFTMIINKRINDWAEKNKKIPEWQAGFRERRGTSEHIFSLNAMIQNQLRKKGGKLYALFVDLKGAFPSVSHELLWRKLSQLGVSHKLINILIDMYNNATMAIRNSEGISEKCQITLGVLQGETLSPLLFSLFLSDIEEFLLKKEGVRGVSINHMLEIIMLAFADDMVFMADSYINFKKIIRVLEEYFDLNKLTVNIKKTKAILFQKGGSSSIKRLPPLLYKNDVIEFIKEYVYLGVPFVKSGVFVKAKELFMIKGKNAIQPTVNLINRLKNVNLETCNKIFKSLVSSIIMYAAPLWSLRYMVELEKIQNLFYRKLFLLPGNTPGYAIRAEFGMEKIEVIIFSLTLNFIERILQMKEERLPKICFKRLQSLAKQGNIDEKYNWFIQVKNKFFDKINKAEFFENIDLNSIIKEKNSLLSEFKEYIHGKDKIALLNNNSLAIFPMLYKAGLVTKYLNLKIPLYYKKILAQIRLINIYNCRILTKNKTFTIKENTHCNICTDEYTILHLIKDCEQIKRQREKLIPEILNSKMDNSIFHILNNTDCEIKARKFVNFIHILIELE